MFTSWCPSASVQRPNPELIRGESFRCFVYVASSLLVADDSPRSATRRTWLSPLERAEEIQDGLLVAHRKRVEPRDDRVCFRGAIAWRFPGIVAGFPRR